MEINKARIIMLSVLLGLGLSIAQAGMPHGDTEFQFETGDVIAHTSQSSQSTMIQIGTQSKYSHVGVVFVKNGKAYVLESLSTTKFSTVDSFIDRGKNDDYTVYRYGDWQDGHVDWQTGLTAVQKKKLKASVGKYKGKRYDLAFKWSDDKIYCSELVWKMYEDIDIELSKPKKMKNFPLWIPKFKQVMEKRWGGKVNKQEPVVSPKDIVKSDKLYRVYGTY